MSQRAASVAGALRRRAPTSVVDAKCRETGVKCVRGARRFKAMSVDRMKYRFRDRGVCEGVRHEQRRNGPRCSRSLPHARQRARNEAAESTRLSWNAKGAALLRGVHRRQATSHRSTTKGQSLQYVDTKQATSQGVAVTPAAFLAPAARVESIRPVLSASVLSGGGATRTPAANGAVGHLGDMQLEQAPSPQVTNTLKIPVSIKLGELRCYDESTERDLARR